MLIFRYLAREVFATLASLTTILLLIFMSNQFVRYLNRAAAGQIPAMIIMKLMMLELPNLMGLLLPLGLYVSFLTAYGRLYTENEITVLQACGYGPNQLLKHSLWLAGAVTVVVGIIMIWASPIIATERTKLLRTTGIQTVIQTITPGRFQAVAHGKEVFYVEAMNHQHTQAHHVFLARQQIKDNALHWEIMLADQAYALSDDKTHEDYIILKNGKTYEGSPGKANYRVAEFGQVKARLPHPKVALENDMRTMKTKELLPLFNADPRKAAELQWRLSIPLMVIILTLSAIPLSRINPRSGKYAKLLPAIVLFFIYANFLFVAKNWLSAGKIPQWLGVWWLHILMTLIGIVLIWRNRIKLS